MIAREAVVEEARTWIGTRWQHQARLKGVGTDCLGMVVGTAVALEVPGVRQLLTDPALQGYGRTPVSQALLDACDRYMERIAVSAADLGDVLVIGFQHGPQHFAIVSCREPLRIIHAYAQMREVKESSAYLPKSSIIRAYRIPGVAP